jgi:hypothetical protein
VTAIAFGPVPSRRLGLPVAVISNGSPVERDDVQSDLCRAEWVSLKVVERLEAVGRLARRGHGGQAFFVRRFARPASPGGGAAAEGAGR